MRGGSVMARRTAMLRDSLPAICRAVTRQKGIRLVFGGPPRTDGKTIYSNPVPIDASEEQVKIIVGDLDHECAHVLYTDFDIHKREIEAVEEEQRPFMQSLANAIEDTMIERKLGVEYLGCRTTLAESAELLMEQVGAEAIVDTSPGKVLSNYVDAWGRARVLGQKVEPCLKLAREALVEQLGERALDRLDALLATHLPAVDSTAESWRLAHRIATFLEDLEEDPEEEEGASGGGQINQESPNGQNTQSAGGDPDAQQTPQPGDATGDPGPERVRAAAQAILSDQKADPTPFFDRRKQAEQAREDAAREHYVPDGEDAGMDAQDAGASSCQGGRGGQLRYRNQLEAYQQLREEVSGEIRKLSRVIQQHYLTLTRRRWKSSEEGRIDSRRLTQAALGNRQVFREQERRVLPFPAVGLVIDASGSMGGYNLRLAKQAAIVLAETNESLDIRTAIHAFAGDQVRQLKGFDQPLSHARGNLAGLYASGGTPMALALWKAGCAIARRREQRKLLFLVTDGSPSDLVATMEVYRMLDASGIEVYGVGINSGAVARFTRSADIVSSADQVAGSILATLRQRILRPVA
ncbi:MAG: VWA domain-containing protein [Chloroflexi bacterium]|nr:MAG: VWA domain-containing protein [Chloroflexota bacterium]